MFIRIPEELVLFALKGDGPPQPHLIKGALIQIKQALDQEGVVIGEALDGGGTFAEAPLEDVRDGIVHVLVEELCCLKRIVEIGRVAQDLIALAEGGNHQTVPGGHNLVVQIGPRPSLLGLEELLTAGIEQPLDFLLCFGELLGCLRYIVFFKQAVLSGHGTKKSSQ